MDGFSEFKRLLALETDKETVAYKSDAITAEDSLLQIMNKVFRVNIQILQQANVMAAIIGR